MAPDRRLIGFFLWKFVPVDDRGFIYWRWEARTQSGQLVHSSGPFQTRTECELDAIACGYVPPDRRH